jgi:phosphoribosylformimino-5-aminoimidazole carboxamide ribotide isomerase
MLLIIPVVEIKGGRCVQMVQGVEGFVYSDDPMEMAKLWRKENAKTMHVTDVDGALEGHPVNHEMIARMARTIDIPIELGGGLRTFDDVKRAFDEIGVYRVVLGTMFIQNPDEAKRAIDTFGPSKVIVAIDEYNRHVKVKGWIEDSGLLATSAALNAKALGFRRIVYSDITAHGLLRSPNFDFIKYLAETTHLRITASGGVAGLDDLLKMQELEPLGVDSVLIGRALYANKFACQGIWRMCEAGDFPYTAKV